MNIEQLYIMLGEVIERLMLLSSTISSISTKLNELGQKVDEVLNPTTNE